MSVLKDLRSIPHTKSGCCLGRQKKKKVFEVWEDHFGLYMVIISSWVGWGWGGLHGMARSKNQLIAFQIV